VLVMRLNRDGTVKSAESLISGFIEVNTYLGRPVDVQPLRDGSVLVSDDWNGAIYRVTWSSALAARRR